MQILIQISGHVISLDKLVRMRTNKTRVTAYFTDQTMVSLSRDEAHAIMAAAVELAARVPVITFDARRLEQQEST